MKIRSIAAATMLGCLALSAQAAPTVTNTTDATALANAIVGSGITISNAVLLGTAEVGTFSGGAGSVGFASGIVLTTGFTSCITAANTGGDCGNSGPSESRLEFDFTSSTGDVFFNFVFGSEEFTQFAPSTFNDTFELLLNGVNIAKLPTTTTGTDIVQINNVNCLTNSQYYRNNTPASFGEDNNPTSCGFLNLDIGYDGLTTVLTAKGSVTAGTTNRFAFTIRDVGDTQLDSGVFIQAGTFSGTDPNDPGTNVPEPASLALAGLALAGIGAARRRRG